MDNNVPLSQYNDLLSVKDLSEIFKPCCENTIRKRIKAGDFGTPIKMGRPYMIPKIYVLNKFFYNNTWFLV